MSYFKAILAVIISFYTSSSLMGMDSFSKWWNKTEPKHYFEPELQKALTLIMLKNRCQKPFDQNTDVLKIIAKNNYDLHCNELLQSKIGPNTFENYWKDELRRWGNDDDNLLNAIDGQKIEIKDFDFITLNDQGREIFLHTLHNTRYGYTDRPCFIEHYNYNEKLKLPLTLRSKMGNLCIMNVCERKGFVLTYIDTEIKPLIPEKYVATIIAKSAMLTRLNYSSYARPEPVYPHQKELKMESNERKKIYKSGKVNDACYKYKNIIKKEQKTTQKLITQE